MKPKRFQGEKLLNRCPCGNVMATLSLTTTGAIVVRFAIIAVLDKMGKNTCSKKPYFI